MMRGCLIKLQNDENPDEAVKVTTYNIFSISLLV